MLLISPVAFEGNPSLLEICLSFSGAEQENQLVRSLRPGLLAAVAGPLSVLVQVFGLPLPAEVQLISPRDPDKLGCDPLGPAIGSLYCISVAEKRSQSTC